MIFSNKLKIGVSTVLRVSTVIAFCLFMFIPIAQAEQPYDITSCHSGKIKALFADCHLRIKSAPFFMDLKFKSAPLILGLLSYP